mgnify:CR=1 FL=1
MYRLPFTIQPEVFEAQFPKMRPAKVIVEYGEPIYPDKLDKEEKKHIGAYTQNVILEMLKRNESMKIIRLSKKNSG